MKEKNIIQRLEWHSNPVNLQSNAATLTNELLAHMSVFQSTKEI